MVLLKSEINFLVFYQEIAMKKIIILLVLLILIGCNDDKITNPDSTVFEKTVKPSSEEQIIESGSEFKMIFPANSISGNLDVKVKKESSVPAINITNLKAGKNFFKIKFSGDTDFLKPVQIIINYDKSAIPTGKTAQESVFGYIYSSGAWKLADYQLDEPNGKIIISISSILGKINKDEPILLDDGEIIIGGYTTTDTGQNDDLLEKLKYHRCKLSLGDITIIKNSNGQEYPYELTDITSNTGWEVGPGVVDSVFVKWQGSKFSFIQTAKNEAYDIRLSISGEVDKSTWKVNNMIYNYSLMMKVSETMTSNYDILIHFNQIKGRFTDVGDLGQYLMLEIDSKANDNPSNHDQDLNKIIKDISFTMSWSKNGIVEDFITLKSINDLTKNRFSLDLRNQP